MSAGDEGVLLSALENMEKERDQLQTLVEIQKTEHRAAIGRHADLSSRFIVLHAEHEKLKAALKALSDAIVDEWAARREWCADDTNETVKAAHRKTVNAEMVASGLLDPPVKR
jgi:hypothetical protein